MDKVRILTPEQRQWVDSIVKPKRRGRRNPYPKYVSPTDNMNEEEKWNYYFDNCIFWLKEYQEGRTTIERALETIQSITNHIKNKPPNK